MKNVLSPLIIVSIIVTLLCLSWKATVEPPDKAIVEKYNDLYLFYLSKPVSEVETLGQVKVNFVATGKPEELLDVLTKKAHKEFPQAQGIIIGSASMDRADVIKFKQ